MKTKIFKFFLLLLLILSRDISFGSTSLGVSGGDPSSPLPAQYVVRPWVIYGDCLWNIAGEPWAYNDPTQWRILYEANKHKMPQPDNPDLILIGMVLDIPSLDGEVRRGVWTETGVSVSVSQSSDLSVARVEAPVRALDTPAILPTPELAPVTTEDLQGAQARFTVRDYSSALDSIILELPGPGQIRNNKYLVEGARLTNLSQMAFEDGEYDASIRYSEEAIHYAMLSDVWVSLQLVIDEVIASRNQALAMGAGYVAPDYFLEIDNFTLDALHQYELGNYFYALDSGVQILEMYNTLTIGVEAYILRMEIEDRDFFDYDPVNISLADEIAYSALDDLELGNIESASIKANEVLTRYTQSMGIAKRAFALDMAMAVSAEHQRALVYGADEVFRQEYDAAYAILNQGIVSFLDGKYDESAELYIRSRNMFITLIDSTLEIVNALLGNMTEVPPTSAERIPTYYTVH